MERSETGCGAKTGRNRRTDGVFSRDELGWLAGGIILLAVAGGAIYYCWQYWLPSGDEPLPTLTLPLEPQAPKPNAGAAAMHYPFPQGREALPPLDDSDGALQDALAGLFGPEWLGDLFYRSELVRRFVVTVDNLPRRKLPAQALLLKPPGGNFLATRGATPFIAPENAARYRLYAWLAEAMDAKRVVAAYVYFYPLLQEEYRLLGYPYAQFNDRVVEAIDDLLATPDVDGPIELVQPRVLYEFADPDLEAVSAGEKIMLRMGAQDAATIKAKLHEIRHELIGKLAKR